MFGRKGYLKNTDIFISEDLPKLESVLLFECRKLSRQNVIAACYSRDLCVYMKTLQGAEIPIKTQADLDSVTSQLTAARQQTTTHLSWADTSPAKISSNPYLGRSLPAPQATSTPTGNKNVSNSEFHSTTSINPSDFSADNSEIYF